MNLRYKVLVGYFILIVLIGFMASILVRERHRISEIDLQNSEVQQAIRDIHNVHRYITRLTMLGESVIDWKRHIMSVFERQEEADSILVNHLPEVAKRATRLQKKPLQTHCGL